MLAIEERIFSDSNQSFIADFLFAISLIDCQFLIWSQVAFASSRTLRRFALKLSIINIACFGINAESGSNCCLH